MTLNATIAFVSSILKNMGSFKIKRQSAKAVCDLINWLYQRELFKGLFTLAVVKAGKRIQKRNIRIIEGACEQKDGDAEHIEGLRWTLRHLEKVERGELTLKEFEHIYEEREDGDDALDAYVRLNDRLEELGAFKKNLLWQILAS